MNTSASTRILVRLFVVTMGALPACLPGVACLSGGEQCGLMQAWTGTVTGLLAGALAEAAPRDVPGDGGILDDIWNGGVDWTIGLIQQTAGTCICRAGDCAPPLDPFPFPDTQTVGCCD